MSKSKGYLVEVSASAVAVSVNAGVADFDEENSLQSKYEKIGCDTVDVVRLPMRVDVWVDDEGLLKEMNPVMEYSIKVEGKSPEKLLLAGNAFFLSYDEQGNTIGLSSEQLEWIQKNIHYEFYGMSK